MFLAIHKLLCYLVVTSPTAHGDADVWSCVNENKLFKDASRSNNIEEREVEVRDGIWVQVGLAIRSTWLGGKTTSRNGVQASSAGPKQSPKRWMEIDIAQRTMKRNETKHTNNKAPHAAKAM